MHRFIASIVIFSSITIGFIATAESKTLFPTNGNSKLINLRKANPYKIDLNITQANYVYSRYTLPTDLNQDTTISHDSRTPLAAFIIGFAPGFFVRGLGHYYIGKPTAGTLLLISEVAGVYLSFSSIVAGTIENKTASERRQADSMGHWGMLLFFSGWFVDFIGAPAELAHEQGERAMKKRLSLDMKDNRVILKYSIAF